MSFTTQAIALSSFLGICGLILSEALLYLQQLMVARCYALLVAVVVCWLFLDGLVTAQDLQRATQDTTTDYERLLLRQMSSLSQQNNVLRTRLENEISLHLETAMALDRMEDNQPRKRGGFALKRSVSDYDITRTQ